MKRVIMAEVHDESGGMTRIQAIDPETGESVLDFVWDPRDEQTPENRLAFRKWATGWLERKGYFTRQ
jgi:hypothetical protein